jgi:hypothetical protein
VVACLILLVGAGIMFRDQRIGFADSLRDWFLPRPTTSSPCLGVPNAPCAARAARAAGGLIAWVPAPTGFAVGHFEDSLFVYGHRTYETLRSTTDGAVLRLGSNVPSGPDKLCENGACTHRRAARVDNRRITVRWGFANGTGDFAVASWTQQGRRFVLSTTDPYGPVDLAWFANVLRSVQYASP